MTQHATEHPTDVSEEFLLAVRREGPTDEFEETLAGCDSAWIAERLDSDGDRLAFWVNLYNAGTQQLLETHGDRYDERRTFFSLPAVTVAGRGLSLDDIEHHILRRSYSKYTFGYVRNPFRGSFASRHELDERDPRIHFALNCGAESCPPIAAYTRDGIDGQLDWATEGYLEATVQYDPDADRVRVPRVMLWFRGDFRVAGGVREFLRQYDQIPADASPSVRSRDWNWSLAPGKFGEDRQAPEAKQ